MVQIQRYVPGSQGVSNTQLDFDQVDEANFIQEDAALGTDFINGLIALHSTGEAGNTEPQKLIASDKAASDYFGRSVAISGNTCIIGSYGEDPSGIADAGSAYTFKIDTTYYSLGGFYVTTSDLSHFPLTSVNKINFVTTTQSEPANTALRYLASFDGRATWDKWGGTTWTTHSGGLTDLTNGNTKAEIESGFTNYTVASGTNYIDLAMYFESTDASKTPSLDLITINYDEEGIYRTTFTDYIYDMLSATQTKITKISAGTDDTIKVNILI